MHVTETHLDEVDLAQAQGLLLLRARSSSGVHV
jgi:hypothetical protein